MKDSAIAQRTPAILAWPDLSRETHGEGLPSRQLGDMVLLHTAPVVAAIAPWNFPAAMITPKVARALTMGLGRGESKFGLDDYVEIQCLWGCISAAREAEA